MKGRLALSLESTSARMGRLGRGHPARTSRCSTRTRSRRASTPSRIDDIAALAGELFAPARALRRRASAPTRTCSPAGLDALLVGGGVTRVAVVGATGRLGAPICAGDRGRGRPDAGGPGGPLARRRRLRRVRLARGGARDQPRSTSLLEASGPDSRGGERAAGAGARHRRRGRRDRPGRRRRGRRSATSRARAGMPLHQVPNFAIGAVLMLQFAAGGGGAHARLRRSSRSTTPRSSTGRAAPRGCTADLIERAGAPRPEISSVRLPGLVAHQSVVFGAPRPDAHDPPRHDQPRGVRAGRPARAAARS